MLVPLVFADLCIEAYHRICFPLYGLPYVPRRRYIRIWDRARLRYLAFPERIFCAYCGYTNGWLHYAAVIAAETETYWCGIQHRVDGTYEPASHEQRFLPYGDEVALRDHLSR